MKASEEFSRLSADERKLVILALRGLSVPSFAGADAGPCGQIEHRYRDWLRGRILPLLTRLAAEDAAAAVTVFE